MSFTLETDASGTAIGAVFLQQSCPIAFFSKQLCPQLQKASTYVRELHAITTAVRPVRAPLCHHDRPSQFEGAYDSSHTNPGAVALPL